MAAVKAEKVDVSANVIRNYIETLSHAVPLALKFLTMWLTSCLPSVVVLLLFFNSWVRASVPRVIAGTEICKSVTRSLVVDALRN